MRIARFSKDGQISFGVVEHDPAKGSSPDELASLTVAAVLRQDDGSLKPTGTSHALGDVRLLPPVLPSKIVAFGRNYAEHAAELGNEVPDVPVTFLKPSTSVVGPGDPVPYPSFSSEVHHEAELAVVIGRVCRDVPVERVPEVILGYTCANDLTARDAQRAEKQWARAKGFDGACPLGPWIENELDPADLAVTCTVNGEVRQSGRTSQMIRSVAEQIAFVSQAMTLLPGDVILTGTPAGVGPVQVGDEVAVTIEGIGTLTNRMVKRD
ncbi:2-hydroxyhepta-2,4-diene-1,7-dioate isomerase [Mangrovactinospora gilvigrisea]|uniref:2-hydroxyhepta-2,4-diene-1,7-dioate isomerase n=1 Tax=Mangrovactinospora gilvigrisea TaxID=1428644 RepID=A0A1J7BVZ1_9ACTN|nr:fumarylacetoacetate hydrolase family protein [Mangrovactinospora gilvigrisea]OIV37633.1 2-hydroxyhepta-2,4-diene-1,7-dioate isomerase [Mangrovactinospora gilvigrisea]